MSEEVDWFVIKLIPGQPRMQRKWKLFLLPRNVKSKKKSRLGFELAIITNSALNSLHDVKIDPRPSHLSPRTSHLAPRTSHLSPLTSHLSPLTSHLSPLTSHLSPLTSHLSPLTSHLSPLTSHRSQSIYILDVEHTSGVLEESYDFISYSIIHCSLIESK